MWKRLCIWLQMKSLLISPKVITDILIILSHTPKPRMSIIRYLLAGARLSVSFKFIYKLEKQRFPHATEGILSHKGNHSQQEHPTY